MAETIKLWHFNTEAAYKDANNLGKINYQDISFIKDKTSIITNGAIYNCKNTTTNINAVLSKINEGTNITIDKTYEVGTDCITSITINASEHSHEISDIIGLEFILDQIDPLPNGTINNQVLT